MDIYRTHTHIYIYFCFCVSACLSVWMYYVCMFAIQSKPAYATSCGAVRKVVGLLTRCHCVGSTLGPDFPSLLQGWRNAVAR